MLRRPSSAYVSYVSLNPCNNLQLSYQTKINKGQNFCLNIIIQPTAFLEFLSRVIELEVIRSVVTRSIPFRLSANNTQNA